jgi:alkanesulfonate monooxygenase SsuD/methylene tetrahydromethanopterin reductase-like flavin-dependent oxidoreductase (luciferase family)
MALLFGLHFDFRNPAIAGTTQADRFAAALDMVEWGDSRGCYTVTLSEHHGSPDGYLPSPLPVLAAMSARTTQVRFMVAALIAPFYDPIRLAEDLVVLDHLSRGRVDLIVAGGYVREEFVQYGVPMDERGARVTSALTTLKAAFTGEPFDYQGRSVHITPAPFRPGGPALLLGGSSDAAARRAARIADGYVPSRPDSWPAYCAELAALGKPDPGPCRVPEQNRTIALAKDVEQGWGEYGPYFLHEANAYAAWAEGNEAISPYRAAADLDELRTRGDYVVLTPEEYVAELQPAPFPFALLHPMCGGTPPELAWQTLRLLEQEVAPAFA